MAMVGRKWLLVFSMCLCSVHVVVGSEPKCSEFHFLESLLEKLVRLEQKVDSFMEASKTENRLLRQDVKNLTESKTLMKEELLSTIEDVTLMKRTWIQQPVAFHALLANSQSGLVHGDVIKFDKVKTNVGNRYDPVGGVFTAPVHGLYMFSVSIISYKQPQIEVQLILNGGHIARAYANVGEHLDQGSITAMTEVSADDRLWVQVSLPAEGGSIGAWDFTSFSGCLLALT